MKPIQPRNKPAEAEFRRLLKLWNRACENLDDWEEKSLAWLFKQLEGAYRRIGYDIGEKDNDDTNAV